MVVRRYKNSIPNSSYNGIIKVINKYKLSKLFKIKKSPIQIQCIQNGYCIDFQGLDDPNKLKSAEAIVGSYKLLVFEEAQEISQRALCDEVISTFERGEHSDGFKCCFIFNPSPNKKHWVNVDLRDSNEELDLLALKVNYCDIPKDWVGKQQLKEIERIRKANYKLYLYRYKGEPISAEDLVFENIIDTHFTYEQIEKFERESSCIFCGIDFGFKPDPNAAVEMYYDFDNRSLYIFREFYKGELNNQQISNGLEDAGFDKGFLIIGDSANPKEISDLKADGWYIRPCNKALKTVAEEFNWLQGLSNIFIDSERCPNTFTEFSEYHYELDKDGALRNDFKWNQADHSIASCRYGLEPVWSKGGN